MNQTSFFYLKNQKAGFVAFLHFHAAAAKPAFYQIL